MFNRNTEPQAPLPSHNINENVGTLKSIYEAEITLALKTEYINYVFKDIKDITLFKICLN